MEKQNIGFENEKIRPSLEDNIARIEEICGKTSDLLVNRFICGGVNACLLCCEGMFSTATITELVLRPITLVPLSIRNSSELFDYLNNRMLLSADRVSVECYGELFRTLNSGFAVFIAEGSEKALAFGVQGYDKRGIDEPSGESNILGAHEGFCEVVRTNMSLLRRRLKSPVFRLELSTLGSCSKTDICLCYMSDRVPKRLLEKIKASLKEIELESILSTGYIRPFLESPSPHIFDSVGTTERPDVLCAKLIEGRVALLVDGVPFALVIPKLFTESFQTLDDYAFKPFYAFFIRWIKYLAFAIAVLLPAVYVAFAVHHPEQLNPTLLNILNEEEKNAPFPLLAEAFGVLLMYEVIKEAGLRLPAAVGGAVSIVGGLIIGDAAVSSGLISTPMLTVAALAVVSGFVVPDLAPQISVLRLCILLAGGIFGLFGIAAALAIVCFNLCATDDYGFPATAPLSPFSARAMRDTAVRVGFRKLQKGGFTVEKLKQSEKKGSRHNKGEK